MAILNYAWLKGCLKRCEVMKHLPSEGWWLNIPPKTRSYTTFTAPVISIFQLLHCISPPKNGPKKTLGFGWIFFGWNLRFENLGRSSHTDSSSSRCCFQVSNDFLFERICSPNFGEDSHFNLYILGDWVDQPPPSKQSCDHPGGWRLLKVVVDSKPCPFG